MAITHRSPYVPQPVSEVRTIDDPVRILPLAEANVERRRWDPLDILDGMLCDARALKIKLVAAHAYPNSKAEAREWRRTNRSYLGGIDLSDEIDAIDDLIEQFQMQIRMQKQADDR